MRGKIFEHRAEPENVPCPDCGRPLLHIGLLPRPPFWPMRNVFHCDACQHVKLRDGSPEASLT